MWIGSLGPRMFWGTRATNFSIYTTKMEGAGPQLLGTGAKFKQVPCQKNCRVNRAIRVVIEEILNLACHKAQFWARSSSRYTYNPLGRLHGSIMLRSTSMLTIVNYTHRSRKTIVPWPRLSLRHSSPDVGEQDKMKRWQERSYRIIRLSERFICLSVITCKHWRWICGFIVFHSNPWMRFR